MGKPDIIIKENPFELAVAGANALLRAANESVSLYGRFRVALSGGRTPEKMFGLLLEEPFISGLPWEKMFFFWVDERCVPFNDPSSNFGTAWRVFLSHVRLREDQIHPMPADMNPEKGSRSYWQTLARFFQIDKTEIPVFDLLFLGMGNDGHTASLFPGDDSVENTRRPVVAVKGGDPHVYRLTLTYRVINQAREIIFLVSGKEKARILRSVLEVKSSTLPAGRVRPLNGRLTWIIDREAASLLEKYGRNGNVSG
ncbi:MAG: 6-phosphogluconolactonase [Deltaproteobacteria bacterium]|nr:6-phosphogluconolactonase [Deltaproteobacteria bacterium]